MPGAASPSARRRGLQVSIAPFRRHPELDVTRVPGKGGGDLIAPRRFGPPVEVLEHVQGCILAVSQQVLLDAVFPGCLAHQLGVIDQQPVRRAQEVRRQGRVPAQRTCRREPVGDSRRLPVTLLPSSPASCARRSLPPGGSGRPRARRRPLEGTTSTSTPTPTSTLASPACQARRSAARVFSFPSLAWLFRAFASCQISSLASGRRRWLHCPAGDWFAPLPPTHWLRRTRWLPQRHLPRWPRLPRRPRWLGQRRLHSPSTSPAHGWPRQGPPEALPGPAPAVGRRGTGHAAAAGAPAALSCSSANDCQRRFRPRTRPSRRPNQSRPPRAGHDQSDDRRPGW